MTQADKLKARTFDFAVAVFKTIKPLARNMEARVPMGQLVRASASVGANYRAVCRAKSKRDFIAKLGTVIEEADESMFWLEYLQETELMVNAATRKLRGEANELVSIFTASQKTARANYARERNERRRRRRQKQSDDEARQPIK
jgi:four helix bundle protein